MQEDLTVEQIQAVPCPTCGAQPGEKCELSTGLPRLNPHRDRRLTAEDDEPFRSEITDELDRMREKRLSREKSKKSEIDEAAVMRKRP